MQNPAAPASSGRADLEIGKLIDTASLGGTHWRIALLALAAIVLDGYDLQILGFAAPALMQEWGITRADLAPIFAAGMVGVAIGGLLVGPQGDVWGRKRAIILSVIFFGLTTLACAYATSPAGLLVLRLLAGIGLGGALTNATALVVETAPMRWRSLLTMATMVGVPVGGVIGGEVSARLIPAQGWESVFVVGGVVPLALAVALALWMPESARFLLRANRPGAEVARAVNALIGEERFRPEDPLWLEEPAARKASFKDLFGTTLRRDTLGVWTIFLTNLFGMFCFLNWLPTVLASLGHDLATSSRMLGAYNLGGIAGTVLAAWLIGYIGSRRVLAGVAAGGVLAALLMGQADLSLPATALALCVFSGICLNAMQVGAYLLSAHVYPTTVRATGVGSAVAVGRIGALASSFAGAIVGTGAGGASLLFGIVAFSMLLVLGGVMLVRNHVPAHH